MLSLSNYIESKRLAEANQSELAEAWRYMQWDPILKVLKNVNMLIKEENPINLRYIFINMSTLNLVEILGAMGYEISD